MTDLAETVERIAELAAKATPGEWRWFGNAGSQSLYLATVDRGRRFVMQFARWGMRGAQPRFQVSGRMVDASELVTFEVCHAVGVNAAYKDTACYRYDVVGIDHPDAMYIAAVHPQAILAILAELARVTGERDTSSANYVALLEKFSDLERQLAEAKAAQISLTTMLNESEHLRRNPPPNATEAVLRIQLAEAKAQARTPGTVEVCEGCGIKHPFPCDEPMSRCPVAKANNWT